MKEFIASKREELAMLAGTIERLFPNNDDRLSAIALLAWTATAAVWTEQKRNALPLIKDRVQHLLLREKPKNGVELPGRRLLEESGWFMSTAEEVDILKKMFAKESPHAADPQDPAAPARP